MFFCVIHIIMWHILLLKISTYLLHNGNLKIWIEIFISNIIS